MSERPQHPANEMRAEAGFHTDHARRQFLERVGERQSLDFATERDLPIGIKADDMKNILSDIDADRCQDGSGVLCSCFHRLLLLLLCGYQSLQTTPPGEAAGPSH